MHVLEHLVGCVKLRLFWRATPERSKILQSAKEAHLLLGA